MDPLLFERTVQFVKNISNIEGLAPLSAADRLKLYSLYKQATSGPCCGPRPSMFDIQGKYKYDAWKELVDMPRSQAAQLYAETVLDLASHFPAPKSSPATFDTGGGDTATAAELVHQLRNDAALLWPQRFAPRKSPVAGELADEEEANYERDEVASYGLRDLASVGSPLVLSDEIRMPFPATLSSILGGSADHPSDSASRMASSDLDAGNEDEDPLHVKEPHLRIPVDAAGVLSGGGALGDAVSNARIYYRLQQMEEKLACLQDQTASLRVALSETRSSLRLIFIWLAATSGTVVLSLLVQYLTTRRRGRLARNKTR